MDPGPAAPGNGRTKTRRPAGDGVAIPAGFSGDAVVEFILSHGGRTADSVKENKPRAAKAGRPAPAAEPRPLRFIDLFCGIGGFRLAFERAGARCVFSSDWDKFSRQTYAANFGEEPAGDINAIPIADIPTFDILCGGFPCQPFSLAGVSKKNSFRRIRSFEDGVRCSNN
ncbi:MAG TPA: DNA (cytosine-5-)-methyltransferase [Tepidisphaeraceae bacterium]|jgi:hypothetical protein